jgi:hypothetical protein
VVVHGGAIFLVDQLLPLLPTATSAGINCEFISAARIGVFAKAAITVSNLDGTTLAVSTASRLVASTVAASHPISNPPRAHALRPLPLRLARAPVVVVHGGAIFLVDQLLPLILPTAILCMRIATIVTTTIATTTIAATTAATTAAATTAVVTTTIATGTIATVTTTIATGTTAVVTTTIATGTTAVVTAAFPSPVHRPHSFIVFRSSLQSPFCCVAAAAEAAAAAAAAAEAAAAAAAAAETAAEAAANAAAAAAAAAGGAAAAAWAEKRAL